MRRTTVSPSQIETILRGLFFATLLTVAVGTILLGRVHLDTATTLLTFAVAIVKPALALSSPRFLPSRSLLLSLFDLLIISVLFFLTGGRSGIGLLLLFPFVALAATRLSLENALVLSLISSLIFSMDWVPLGLGHGFGPDWVAFSIFLVITAAIVLIVHFAVTGQREAAERRRQEEKLADARRILSQEQALVELGRDITNTAKLNSIVEIVLATTSRMLPGDRAAVALLDENRRLVLAGSTDGRQEAGADSSAIGASFAADILKNQRAFYSPDIQDETRLPAPKDGGRAPGFRSYLGVPLVTRGHCIGVLHVESGSADAFSEESRRLLETIAAQASGPIENARLLQSRQEFSERLQEAYHTANELTTHFDLDLILEEFVQRAAELLDARYAAGLVADDQGNIERLAGVGLTPEQTEQLRSAQGRQILNRVLDEKKPLRINNGDHGSAQSVLPPGHPLQTSILAAPLIARGETQGAIYLSEKNNGQEFSPEDEDLLMIFSAGASAALSNARLYVQLRRNIEQLYALHQIGQAIGSSLSPEDVYRVFNVDVRHLCGAEASVISEWNTARNSLVIMTQEGPDDLVRARSLPTIGEQIEQATRAGQAASVTVELQEGKGTLFGYLAPLIVRGRVIGLAEIYAHTSGVVSPESSSIFLTLATQLAVSMENARLYTQLQKREQQLRNFVGRLFQAEDAERRRLAYDIHDGLAQLIVSADMHMNNYASMRGEDPDLAEQQLDKALVRLKASLTEVRRVVSELRPSTLDDFGLINTLRRYVEQLAKEQGWDYSFEENLGDIRLDMAIENGAYRIVQESLSNIRKYSETPRVEVEMRIDTDFLHIRVQDWGRGFDLEEARQREGHFGLSSMEERARLLGGRFQIETRPGEGTRINVDLPCYRAIPPVRP